LKESPYNFARHGSLSPQLQRGGKKEDSMEGLLNIKQANMRHVPYVMGYNEKVYKRSVINNL